MLVFVDESGDTGLDIENGASEYFHIVAVVFRKTADADLCDIAIDELRKKLKLRKEFKFNKLKKDYRVAFLSCVSRFNWQYFVITINKQALYGKGFSHKQSFYKYTLKLVLSNAAGILSNATVIIDSSDTRKFRHQLAAYLRDKVNTDDKALIKKVKSQESHRNNLLQLADMVAGAVARSFRSDKTDKETYRNLIVSKEVRSQVWPLPKKQKK